MLKSQPILLVLLLAGSTLVPVVSPVGAVAAFPAFPPVLASGTSDGAAAWTVMHAHFDKSGQIGLTTNTTFNGGYSAEGFFFASATGPSFAYIDIMPTAGEPQYYFESNLAPNVTLQKASSPSPGGGSSSAEFIETCQPYCADGDYTITHIVVGATKDWAWTLGATDATLGTSTTGTTGTFSFQTSDFRGTLAAGYGAGLVDVDANAHAPVHNQGSLVGYFSANLPMVASITTPMGTTSCPCLFPALTGPAAQGPGDYDFQLTGAETLDGVILFGATIPSNT